MPESEAKASDATDLALDLEDFGLDIAEDIQYGDGLTSTAVDEHTEIQKELKEQEQQNEKKKIKKKKRKHVLTSDTAKALKETDTSWAVHELADRLNQYKSCCKSLLQAKTDPNVRDADGFTVRDICFHQGTVAFDIHNLLEVYGAKHSLFYAAYFGHDMMMHELLALGQDPKVINRRYFSTALHLACEAGQTMCAMILLEANCDPTVKDSHGRMAIHYGAAADYDVAELLINWKVDVNVTDNDGLSPLDYTFDDPTIKALRKKGATASLFGSVAGGHADRVRSLLKGKADVTDRNKLERTVLHIAANNGETSVLKALVERVGKDKLPHCDPNVQDYIGWSPLHYAVEKRHKRVVKFLLEANGDPELEDTMGKHPFQYAIEYRWKEIIEMLRPHVKDSDAYLRSKGVEDAGLDGTDSAPDFVFARVPPPTRPEDIPPGRKSGRARQVQFM
jgi:ankyrin repeat protein